MFRKAIGLVLFPALGFAVLALVVLAIAAIAGLLGAIASARPTIALISLCLGIYVLLSAVGVWAGWEFLKEALFSIPRSNARRNVSVGFSAGAVSGLCAVAFISEKVGSSGLIWYITLLTYGCYLAALVSWVSHNNSLQGRRP